MKRIRLQVAPHPNGFRVIATEDPSIARPGDVLCPFLMLDAARRWAEVGYTLSLDVIADGVRAPLVIGAEDRDAWIAANGGAA